MAQNIHTLSLNFGHGNAHCGNLTTINNTTFYEPDEGAQIMRWLSPLEPNDRHQSVSTDRFDGVGDWLLEIREFREWRGGSGGADKAVLFCSGSPGVGKTYLSSLVIDSLCDQAKEEDIAITGLYYDFLSQGEQTITNVLGAILKQLIVRGGIPDDLRKAFQEGKVEFGGGLRHAGLMRMLRTAIASLRQVFICIDALDECLPKHLPELLKSLSDIVRESPTTRIFLTGRPHVRGDIQRYFAKVVVIPISPNKDDIRNYLEMRLDRDPDPEAMSDGLRADIVRIILEKTSDIFLLVSLNIDAILGGVTILERRRKLEEMKRGNGLSDAYTATLRRLKAQTGNKSILGLKVLMWASCSQRPLRVEELRHALGVEIGSADLDLENVPALRTLLASCLGLVTVEASSSTIRLVHFTLQEHLSTNPTLFHSTHSTIAEVCLTYLNFRCVRDLSPTICSVPSTMPLLEYASHYWGEHTRKGMTENVKSLALRLLDRFDEHISTQLLLLRYNQTTSSGLYFSSARGPTGFTGLHGVAFLGIAEIVDAVLEMKEWDVNAADCMGSTALTWAIRGGKEETVRALLEQEDIDSNTVDTRDGRTPLTRAAENGHERLVKILLERRDTNPNAVDTKYGRTPLSWAIRCGHEEVVRVLLGREGVNADQAGTQCSRTPLSLAAECGREGVVKMLLGRKGVNPNAADAKSGRTPLSWAAEYGYAGVVEMLLEGEGVNPNTPDTEYGRTPLSWAAENGHERAVKTLLERKDVNADQAGTRCGRTPLSLAAECGREGVVKMLLGGEDVNPNTEDTHGRTPLSWAAENGHTGVVKVLLERGGANPSTAGTQDGRTPLSWTAWCGHEGVAKMLLENNQTPLSLALSKGHDGIARILLEGDNLDPDTGDLSGQASLPPSAGIWGQRIGGKLKDVIMNHRKGLQKMYGRTKAELDKSLKVPIRRGQEMAGKLVKEMGCDLMVATDLTVLTLYDVAILIDDSDSMIYEERGARKETVTRFIDHITEIYSMANESGILAMRFMNNYRGKKNWTGVSQEYLDQHSYGGLSRIGTALKERILGRFAIGNPNQSKPLLVLIVTDGVVEGEEKGHLKKVIQDCVNEREGAGKGRDAVSFQFSLIGNDPGAAKLLEELDQDPDVGEHIDILPVEFDLKHQMEDKWFVLPKILLGAILPDWDKQDDYNYIEEHNYLGDKKDSRDDDSESDWDD